MQQHRLHPQHQQQASHIGQQGEPRGLGRDPPQHQRQGHGGGAQKHIQPPGQKPPPGARLLTVRPGCGSGRLGRRVQKPPVFLRVQGVIAGVVGLHGPAHGLIRPGLLLPAAQGRQPLGQGLGQGQLPGLHGSDLLNGHVQPPQQADAQQGLQVIGAVVPIAVFPPGRMHQPLLFIVSDVGPGQPGALLYVLDMHGVALLLSAV